MKLITSEGVFQTRRPMLILGLLILVGLAAAKIFVAIQRGHYNIMFLVILSAVFFFFLFKIYKKERTGLGDRVLADLKSLFKGLRDRGNSIKSGGETNEAALLAAVFGVAALSTESFPYINKLFPKANNSISTYYSCGCGTSVGSSCGGGGCGSGCGGCGGCGGD